MGIDPDTLVVIAVYSSVSILAQSYYKCGTIFYPASYYVVDSTLLLPFQSSSLVSTNRYLEEQYLVSMLEPQTMAEADEGNTFPSYRCCDRCSRGTTSSPGR